MTYLIAEMLLWLVLAAALGFATAWFIRGALGSQRAAGESESVWSAKLTSAEAGFEARTAAAEAAVARLKADLHAATTKVAALEAEGGKRMADLDAGVGVQLRAAEALASERGVTIEQLRVALNSANTQWGNRLAAAEDKATRLAAALDAAQEEASALSAPVDDGPKSELESQIATLRARIAELESAPPPATKAAKKPARPAPPEGEDDLQTIAGLGPALEKALKARGITTYRALAAVSVEEAKALGATARSNADKWPDQARAQHQVKYGETL
ncbi:hypothetical protein sos41_03880 [Alphaproteobacteria bacterium SO-S41]|nr:hypothetical protein sos41_03880 [Alphaproteobacteria bacterium SO-S41]